MAKRLSKNKAKFIKRNASKLDPPEIAAQLKIPLARVLAELKKETASQAKRKEDGRPDSIFFCFQAVVFLSPLIFSTAFYDFENIPRSLLIQAGAILIPALWLVQRQKKGPVKVFVSPVFMPLLLLTGWALVSIFWSKYQYGAFSQWIHWAACVVICLVVFNLHSQKRTIRVTLHVIMITAVLSSILGMLQYLVGLDWVPQQVLPAAVFNNKNMAAQFIVLTFPISFVFAATSNDRKLTWLYAIFSCAVAIFLFYTRSRAAWLSVLGEMLLIGSYLIFCAKGAGLKPAVDRNRILASATTLLIFFFFTFFGPALSKTFPGSVKTPAKINIEDSLDLSSINQRLVLWKNTLSIIARHPVAGVGIRNVQVYYPVSPDKSYHRLNLHTQRVHNDYLQMYAELGLPALVVFCWIAVLFIKAATGLTRGGNRETRNLLPLICLAAILGLAINAFFSFPFNRAMPPFLLAVYTGLFFRLTAMASGDIDQKLAAKTLSRKTAVATAGGCFIIFIAWGAASYHWALADHYYRKHVVALLSSDYERSVFYGRKALEHNPDRGAILRSLSRVYVRQKDYESAEVLFTRIDRVFPYSSLNLYHQAVARINQKRYGEAEKTIQKGLTVIPRSGKLHGLLGVVCQAENQTERAIREYRRAIVLAPGAKSHYEWLGRLLYEKQRYGEAAGVFSRFLEFDPGNVEIRSRLGLALLNRRRPEQAEEQFREAARLSPDSPDMHRYLGVALTHQGKLDEAILEFQTALRKSGGKDAVAHNNLGSVLARQNRIGMAVDHFRSALKIDPDYTDARANLRKALLLLKNAD